MRDVTGVKVRTDLVVTGVDPKLWVEENGELFLLKCGKEGNELSIYSEYVVSRIMEKLGLPCQQVELVKYNGITWAMCSYVGEIKQFLSIKQSSLETDKTTKEYCMEDVLYEISRMSKLSIQQRYEFLTFFKRVFIVDAWTGNRDRHSGNWGYLKSGEVCPVYDNGAALFPSIERYLDSANLYNLLYRITVDAPKSSIQFRTESGKLKKNNFCFLLANKEMVSEEVEWLKSFDVDSIMLYAVDGLSERLRRYYHYQLFLRFECVICQGSFTKTYGRLKKLPYDCTNSVQEFCVGLEGEM